MSVSENTVKFKREKDYVSWFGSVKKCSRETLGSDMWELVCIGDCLLAKAVKYFDSDATPEHAAKQLLPFIGQQLFQRFCDIPISAIDTIDTSFGHFKEGTERYDVWHWFEEEFGLQLGVELKLDGSMPDLADVQPG